MYPGGGLLFKKRSKNYWDQVPEEMPGLKRNRYNFNYDPEIAQWLKMNNLNKLLDANKEKVPTLSAEDDLIFKKRGSGSDSGVDLSSFLQAPLVLDDSHHGVDQKRVKENHKKFM